MNNNPYKMCNNTRTGPNEKLSALLISKQKGSQFISYLTITSTEAVDMSDF